MTQLRRVALIIVIGLLSTVTLPASAEETAVEVGADGETVPASPTDDGKFKKMEDEIAAMKVIVGNAQGKLSNVETDLAAANKKAAASDAEIAATKEIVATVEGKLSNAETDLAVANEKVAASDARASKAEAELVEAQKKLKSSGAELVAANKKTDATKDAQTKCLSDLASAQQTLEAAEGEAKALTSNVEKLEQKVAGMEAESTKNDQQQVGIVSSLEAEAKKLKGQFEEAASLAAAKVEELANSNAELGKVKAKMDASYCDVDRIVGDAKSYVKKIIG